MKVSRNWLQTFFVSPLPDAQAINDALTFHVFEVEGVEQFRHPVSELVDEVLDVKVTPNRGHDCLSHRGIAKELSALLNIPLKSDPLRLRLNLNPMADAVSISIENPELCRRFTGAYIRNLRVGPSPEWLREALEAIGQRSINNVVDATNFVMFNIGQPLHAFDAGKLAEKNGTYALVIRAAKSGEKMLGLDEKEYALTGSMLVIVDAHTNSVVSVAGIKGGKPTGIDEKTIDIILEAANWDGVTIRKTSSALKLRTDASERFEQVISPGLAAYGIRAAADLIVQLAGGEIVGFVDEYPKPQGKREVGISLEEVNSILGTKFTKANVADVFKRLDLPFVEKGSSFIVTVPFERLDLVIPEDLIEEVGRIIGYDKIPATPLPPFPKKPEVNPGFYAAEHVREELMSQSFSEVLTSVFTDKGERVVANKVDGVRPYLRDSLFGGLSDAVTKNVLNRMERVKLFEIGTVWKDGKEQVMVARVLESGPQIEEVPLPVKDENPTIYENLPLSTTIRYEPFSKYPFIERDIAIWVPKKGVDEHSVGRVITETLRKESSGLFINIVGGKPFDRFEKGDKISLAFHIKFQSFERTLTDAEVNAIMKNVNVAVEKEGWKVR